MIRRVEIRWAKWPGWWEDLADRERQIELLMLENIMQHEEAKRLEAQLGASVTKAGM